MLARLSVWSVFLVFAFFLKTMVKVQLRAVGVFLRNF